MILGSFPYIDNDNNNENDKLIKSILEPGISKLKRIKINNVISNSNSNYVLLDIDTTRYCSIGIVDDSNDNNNNDNSNDMISIIIYPRDIFRNEDNNDVDDNNMIYNDDITITKPTSLLFSLSLVKKRITHTCQVIGLSLLLL